MSLVTIHDLNWPGDWPGFRKLYPTLPGELWWAESTDQSHNHVIRIHLPRARYQSEPDELKKVLANLPRGVPVQFQFSGFYSPFDAPSRP